ncbi:MAG: hypothetical protein U9N85_10610 [Bacteroidota bacterium]|nr:hypothetical protein [Bacteroidota bacterium]
MKTEDIKSVTKQIISSEEFAEKEMFVVDIKLTAGINIGVTVDAFKNVTVGDCSLISKKIHEHFEDSIDNYNLEVSTAGLTNDFKVKEQYKKALGKEIRVIKADGKHPKGILKSVDDDTINIETYSKKKKQETKETINFKDIKSAKLVISF